MVSTRASGCVPAGFRRRCLIAVLAAAANVGCADLLAIPDDPYVVSEEEPGTVPSRPRPAAPTPSVDEENPAVTSPGAALATGSADDGSADGESAESNSVEGDPVEEANPPSPLPFPDRSDADTSDDDDVLPDEPTVPDEPTPPDPCAPGLLGPSGNCYVVESAELPWAEARAACQARGAGWDLAAIHDPETDRFLATLGAGQAWVGASDAESEGTWVWVRDGLPFWSGDGTTGEPIDDAYENWNSDEPNGRGASDCARLVPNNGTWADLECEFLRPSVCEGPLP